MAFWRHVISLHPYFLLHADGDFLRLCILREACKVLEGSALESFSSPAIIKWAFAAGLQSQRSCTERP